MKNTNIINCQEKRYLFNKFKINQNLTTDKIIREIYKIQNLSIEDLEKFKLYQFKCYIAAKKNKL